jgi:hypothetical protein
MSGKKSMKYTSILALCCLLSSLAFAHHSDVGLSMDEVVTIEGVVTEYSLRNPHAYFTVNTVGENIEQIEWTVQMASSITMTRLGWDRETLAIGDSITVGVHPARDGRSYGLIASFKTANGVALLTQPEERPRPVSNALASSIEGRWFADLTRLPDDYPEGLDLLMIRDLVLTDKAKAATEAYNQDSEENPELSCISKPTPSMIIYTDLFPIEISLNEPGETITIRSQHFDEVRSIYMDGRPHPPVSELFHEGHSIGIWEDDVLVIDTTNFTPHRSPYQNGVPSGPQKHVVERYRLIEDGAHMIIEFVLEDPEYIVGSMTHSRDVRFAPESDMSPFDCDIEATRRFVPN